MADFSGPVLRLNYDVSRLTTDFLSTKRVTFCLRNQNVHSRDETQPWRKRYAHALRSRESETILRNQNLFNRSGNYVRKLS